MLHLWHFPEERRLLQYQQQTVLRHSRETSRQAKCTSWHGSNYHTTVSII